jgi:hypothetical protein
MSQGVSERGQFWNPPIEFVSAFMRFFAWQIRRTIFSEHAGGVKSNPLSSTC